MRLLLITLLLFTLPPSLEILQRNFFLSPEYSILLLPAELRFGIISQFIAPKKNARALTIYHNTDRWGSRFLQRAPDIPTNSINPIHSYPIQTFVCRHHRSTEFELIPHPSIPRTDEGEDEPDECESEEIQFICRTHSENFHGKVNERITRILKRVLKIWKNSSSSSCISFPIKV